MAGLLVEKLNNTGLIPCTNYELTNFRTYTLQTQLTSYETIRKNRKNNAITV